MTRDLELDLLRLLAREGGCSRAYCVSALGAHGGAVSQALGRQRRAGHVEAVSVERGGDRWTAHQLTDAGRAWLREKDAGFTIRARLLSGPVERESSRGVAAKAFQSTPHFVQTRNRESAS